jgi:hypothetical protein
MAKLANKRKKGAAKNVAKNHLKAGICERLEEFQKKMERDEGLA